MLTNPTKTLTAVSAIVALLAPLVLTGTANASSTTVPRKCINGVCGSVKYYGGKVRISLSSKLSRTTHFNFKTNPGDQIEVSGGYSFDREPGESGTYSAQACERGGIGARSTCTKWATFDWNSGAQEEEEEQ
jgi:hypothetical protein